MSDKQKVEQTDIASALTVIADSLLGEKFADLGRSLKNLEASVNKRIDSTEADSVRKVKSLETEINTRLDALAGKLESFTAQYAKDSSKMDEKVNKSAEELRRSVSTMGDSLNASILDTKKSLETDLSNYKKKSHNNFMQIDDVLKNHQQEIIQRTKDSKRMSKILENFARILTDPGDIDEKPKQAPKQEQPSEPKPKKKSDSANQSGNDDLPTSDDIAENIDQIFQG